MTCPIARVPSSFFLLLIPVGLATRIGLPGLAGDLGGGVLYVVAAGLVVALLAPRLGAAAQAASAVAFSCGIEVLQATGAPAAGTRLPTGQVGAGHGLRVA